MNCDQEQCFLRVSGVGSLLIASHCGFAVDTKFMTSNEQTYRDCRLIYNQLPTPKQMQTLVQVWKQLWKWR
jgi:hypothetical protein